MKKFRPYDKFPDDIVGKQVRIKRTFGGFVSGCEAWALSGRAACTKPLLADGTGNLNEFLT